VAHKRSNDPAQNQYNGKYEPHTVQLNDWSIFLVLLMMQVQIFKYPQEMIVVGKICGDESHIGSGGGETEFSGCDEFTGANISANLEQRAGSNDAETPTEHHALVADQIRAALRGSKQTGNWAIWKRLAATKTQLAGIDYP
jgi:hypothetical protein